MNGGDTTTTCGGLVAIDALGARLGTLRLCDAHDVARMQRSLDEIGQVSPVIAFSAAPERLEVIDGFKRLRAARALGWGELRVDVINVDGVAAKVAMRTLHAQQGLTELEESWLVRSLYREDRLSQPEIARRLGRDKSWVCRRLMLAEELDDTVLADVRLGLLAASTAITVARLQRCNQRPVAQLVARQGLTSRQTIRLVTELLDCADDDARLQLLQRWGQKTPTLDHQQPPARRARTPGEWLMADIETLLRAGARLEARLAAQPIAALGQPAAAVALAALSPLVEVMSALMRTISAVTAEGLCHVDREYS